MKKLVSCIIGLVAIVGISATVNAASPSVVGVQHDGSWSYTTYIVSDGICGGFCYKYLAPGFTACNIDAVKAQLRSTVPVYFDAEYSLDGSTFHEYPDLERCGMGGSYYYCHGTDWSHYNNVYVYSKFYFMKLSYMTSSPGIMHTQQYHLAQCSLKGRLAEAGINPASTVLCCPTQLPGGRNEKKTCSYLECDCRSRSGGGPVRSEEF